MKAFLNVGLMSWLLWGKNHTNALEKRINQHTSSTWWIEALSIITINVCLTPWKDAAQLISCCKCIRGSYYWTFYQIQIFHPSHSIGCNSWYSFSWIWNFRATGAAPLRPHPCSWWRSCWWLPVSSIWKQTYLQAHTRLDSYIPSSFLLIFAA